MYNYYKSKRVPKLGDSLKGTVERKFLWKAIDAGRVGIIYEKLSEELKEFKGSQMVSWKDGVLRIKVSSSVQRQEIFLKKIKLLAELKKRGIAAKEIKVII